MTVKERAQNIQDLVDELQTDISELDTQFSYYYVLIHNLCACPSEIRIFRRVNEKENIWIATLEINFMDPYYHNNMNSSQIDSEIVYLKENNSPKEQIEELVKLKEFFGI